MNFTAEDIVADATKVDTSLTEEWVYDAEWNLTDPEPITITYNRMQTGDLCSCLDENGQVDFKKIFLKKVIKIENLKINGTPVKSPRRLFEIRSIPELEMLVLKTAMRIFTGKSLTEDEVGN